MDDEPVTIRTLVVDDQAMVRTGLRMLLAGEPDIEVVAEAGDGFAAVTQAARHHPDVVLMDIRMPGLDGLEATKEVTERLPGTEVLLFTAFGERSLLGRGLDAGARGYLLKEASSDTLVRAIEKVANGEAYVDPALMPTFLTRDSQDLLTPRERQILQLLADGMSNAEVAAKLYISQETVKSHVRHILAKLDLRDRPQAIVLAHECGLVGESTTR